MDLVSPTGTAAVAVKRLAARRASLTGCRIAVLDNSKPNAGALLGRVAELLVERADAASVRIWHKPGASHPAANHDEICLLAGLDAADRATFLEKTRSVESRSMNCLLRRESGLDQQLQFTLIAGAGKYSSPSSGIHASQQRSAGRFERALDRKSVV